MVWRKGLTRGACPQQVADLTLPLEDTTPHACELTRDENRALRAIVAWKRATRRWTLEYAEDAMNAEALGDAKLKMKAFRTAVMLQCGSEVAGGWVAHIVALLAQRAAARVDAGQSLATLTGKGEAVGARVQVRPVGACAASA